MSYGARVWGPTGLLELDENSFTVRVVHSEIVQAGVPAPGRARYISIPGVNPATHSAICIPIAAYDTSAQSNYSIQYTPIVSVDGVTVYYGYPGRNTGPLGLSAQRLLVMRIR
ncbi:hypothetical protein C1Y18_11455 [Pseudomonas sp. MPR-R5A]|jgi:hypothetical protein|nr:hypothetical protein C1Y25_12020 [Pseudomonas sp. MPBC4-3]PMX47219.1 hypothetical protein C1Y20_14140 [Pseudomonas sp. FW301-21B01]PMY07940.1 hypothetical protein C1Y18_11455 [Pseudomonas sp. MPR-R5A]PNA66759.1 hypothetical protein C1Y14_19335 [Pseudomonas sp. MPR-R5B]DAH70244.1 MAG TPA: hypothetical protein [Bacteriophage sp.]